MWNRRDVEKNHFYHVCIKYVIIIIRISLSRSRRPIIYCTRQKTQTRCFCARARFFFSFRFCILALLSGFLVLPAPAPSRCIHNKARFVRRKRRVVFFPPVRPSANVRAPPFVVYARRRDGPAPGAAYTAILRRRRYAREVRELVS